METLFTIIALIVIYVIYKAPSWEAGNSRPPQGYETDWAQMNRDRRNGMTNRQIDQKTAAGGYDVPKKK